MSRKKITVDGNEAVARVAHKINEVIAIYPITPSTPMGEHADAWSADGRPNIWGTVPLVIEMQAEGGAAGAVHGALQAGALTTTFTASQGLLLMIPNMYKIAGELTSTVFHVAARSVAAQALSIFGDHSDVMAARATGFVMLASASVQEAHDFAIISQAAALKARLPFIHFFEGFRTSHEINKIEELTDDDLRAMIDDDLVRAHRERALSPDNPFIRGTAQNPDVFFQARETVNPYYLACPGIVQEAMDKFAGLVGRQYRLFDYEGDDNAEHVIVVIGSGGVTAAETAKVLNEAGEKVGVVKVRLYRPFSIEHFLDKLPATVKKIAVLDRTKEPGASGEPLYLDVVNAIHEGRNNGQAPFSESPLITGGRYGLSSKEFTPAMVKGVFDEMKQDQPKNHFTIGINDDLTHTSLDYDDAFSIVSEKTVRAVFYGLGSDGTVGANKNSIKIIGEETSNHAQGYFVYDSKKAGAMTISHLRFGPEPIRAPYLVGRANFVACHQFNFLERYDVLGSAVPGATFLLNSMYDKDETWDHLPREVQETIIEKKLKFYVINGYKVAEETGMGQRINTIMQTCFFYISGILPPDEAIAAIKDAIKKTYGKRGEKIVQQNYAAVDAALANLHEMKVPKKATSKLTRRPPVPDEAPKFVREVLGPMIAREGDGVPVSVLPADGTYPLATTQWEKRNITLDIPEWIPDLCIRCGKCVFVCPHAVIRQKVYDPALLENAPDSFLSMEGKWREFPGAVYSIQVAPEDCTGCKQCVEICPVTDKENPDRKALNMVDQLPILEREQANWEFFLTLPEVDRTAIKFNTIKNSQLLEPLFEFSGACAGCGETPYIKLVTQLFGDRTIVANATGCTSIFGGNLPTTPWAKNKDGRGPAWSNSLFEDNAEFGLGMRLALDKQTEYVREILPRFAGQLGDELVEELLTADPQDETGYQAQRERVALLKERLEGMTDTQARDLLGLADVFVPRSLWIMGGDGWAYDIGYGGLDHVLASGKNVNVLVLDTEVYSNTGGQASKATPMGAIAKFASKGKELPRKDLGMIAMSYGYVYVAQIAMGASDTQTLKAILEAEAYDGPSLIIAYSHCIEHEINMTKDLTHGLGLNQQKLAVDSGFWPLYRFNPALISQGKNPLSIDAKPPKISWKEFAYNEGRFSRLAKKDEKRAEALMEKAIQDVQYRLNIYRQMAEMHYPVPTVPPVP